jgi:hypothetical protein
MATQRRQRLQRWQKALDAGDAFCILQGKGKVAYGVILPPREDLQMKRNERWVRVWAKAHRTGREVCVDLQDIDLPLTRQQMALAESLDWPGTDVAMKLVLRMTAPGEA